MKKFIFAISGVFICTAALGGDAQRCKALADAVNGHSHPATKNIELSAATCEGDKFVIPTILKNEI